MKQFENYILFQAFVVWLISIVWANSHRLLLNLYELWTEVWHRSTQLLTPSLLQPAVKCCHSACFQKTELEAESALRWEAANKTLLLAIVASDARDTRSALFCLKRAEEHCDVRYLCSGVGGRERDADNSSLLMTAYSLLTLTPACLTICWVCTLSANSGAPIFPLFGLKGTEKRVGSCLWGVCTSVS